MIIPHIRDIFICGILGHYHKWLRQDGGNTSSKLDVCVKIRYNKGDFEKAEGEAVG